MDHMYRKFAQNYQNLTKVERSVIDFIMTNEEIADLKLKHIRDALFVSNATIIRACKKLQYVTFNELKYTLIYDRKGENNPEDKSKFAQLVESVRKNIFEDISKLDEELVHQFCLSIMRAQKIYCVGVGSCLAVAKEFSQKLETMHFCTTACSDHEFTKLLHQVHEKQDLILFLDVDNQAEKLYQKLVNERKRQFTHFIISNILTKNDQLGNAKCVTSTVNQPECMEIQVKIVCMLLGEMVYFEQTQLCGVVKKIVK